MLFLCCGLNPLRAETTPIRIVVLGDSLTAGYGLPQQAAFPAQLEIALQGRGHKVKVFNAGVSGDTSFGGLSRLDWALTDQPDLVIIELGANDALRGLQPIQTRQNLDTILHRLKQKNIRAVLAGMKAPRNLGEAYYNSFDSIYPELAQQHQVPLYPFFLDGVAGIPELNQPDGIHPTMIGVNVIVDKMLPLLEEVLEEIAPEKNKGKNKGKK
ncbi:acyl-CoA thioesterase-1 [Malonomonas rubra DSM 5091]|uniref:Acyl-CoA thioesterase-1 n=1 Tax=Malonomonas rubra DSM 5091 TaxID=1122189 RepID=A0A1M6IYU6_MALRU|nr:acyl-CoA thioesterase-1 [Malonomonas rubra DSM 5091]